MALGLGRPVSVLGGGKFFPFQTFLGGRNLVFLSIFWSILGLLMCYLGTTSDIDFWMIAWKLSRRRQREGSVGDFLQRPVGRSADVAESRQFADADVALAKEGNQTADDKIVQKNWGLMACLNLMRNLEPFCFWL